MDKLIRVAAQRIAYGQTLKEVRDFLYGEGLHEEEIYLVYKAASLLARC